MYVWYQYIKSESLIIDQALAGHNHAVWPWYPIVRVGTNEQQADDFPRFAKIHQTRVVQLRNEYLETQL